MTRILESKGLLNKLKKIGAVGSTLAILSFAGCAELDELTYGDLASVALEYYAGTNSGESPRQKQQRLAGIVGNTTSKLFERTSDEQIARSGRDETNVNVNIDYGENNKNYAPESCDEINSKKVLVKEGRMAIMHRDENNPTSLSRGWDKKGIVMFFCLVCCRRIDEGLPIEVILHKHPLGTYEPIVLNYTTTWEYRQLDNGDYLTGCGQLDAPLNLPYGKYLAHFYSGKKLIASELFVTD